MARTLVRPSLYDEDFLAWTEQQAALVRAGRLDQLDLDNLAEELDTMGRSEWGELENRLEVLLMHMLKWDHQPARHDAQLGGTIREQRNAISPPVAARARASRSVISGSPSPTSTRTLSAGPSTETGLEPTACFRERLPYSVAQVLEPAVEPQSGAASPARRRRR